MSKNPTDRERKNMHTINISTEELGYMLELLNNERYTGNTNAVIADTLSAVLHDASWHGESDSTDEEIDAQIAYASRTR